MTTKSAINIALLVLAGLLSTALLTGCKAKPTDQIPNEIASSPTAGASATALPPTATRPAATLAANSASPTPAGETPTETEIASSPTSTAVPQASSSPEATASPAPTATAEPTAASTTASGPASTPPGTPPDQSGSACTNVGAFYKDVTVEDYTFFTQNETFVKTWQVRNEGTCTWGSGYTIIFDSGFALGAPQTSPMPEAAPGQIVNISLDMTAPARGGQYISRWRFKDPNGNVFGVGLDNGQLYTIINVGFLDSTGAGAQPTTQPSAGESTQPTPEPGTSGSCSYSLDTSFAQQLVDIINQARQQAGLNTLNVQSQLTAAAQVHSIDIACHDSYDHLGSDGSLWTDRVARQGYANYTSTRENIRVGDPAFGFSPQYVYDRWFESQIHHDNMFYPTIKDIGISCVINPDSQYKEFCTADFARP